MSTKTAPVDVLAVMDRAAQSAGEIVKASGGDFRAVLYQDDLFKARAAIAELIEADKEYDLAAAALLACTNKPAHTLVTLIDYADEARSRFEAAKTRRAAALANVGGAK